MSDTALKIAHIAWTKTGIDKAVANFFTPLSKKEPDQMTWRIVNDSLLVGRYKAATRLPRTPQTKQRIAAFDFVSGRDQVKLTSCLFIDVCCRTQH